MKRNLFLLTTILLNSYLKINCSTLVAFTFGSSKSDSVKQQIESAKTHNVDLTVIEQNTRVVEIEKLLSMKDYLEGMKNEKETIVLFVGNGSLFLNSSEKIISKFLSMETRILLSADKLCFPDSNLQELYPKVKEIEKRFVNSEGVIGYADTLYNVLTEEKLKSISDHQYLFSILYTDSELRIKFNVKLDSKSEIFQNLDGSFDEISIEHSPLAEGFLINLITGTQPLIVQRNGNKEFFNSLSNYLGKKWDPIRGCQQCVDKKILTDFSKLNDVPLVTLSIFIEQPTPFLNEFFTRISELSYPKLKINMRISNLVSTHESKIMEFIDKHGSEYNSLVYLNSTNHKSKTDRRMEAIQSCGFNNCKFIIYIESVVQITNADMIQHLISYNKLILAPLVSRREQLWSNFWGAIGRDGYYSRSFDYLDLVNGIKKGVWNVPHIHSIFIMKSELIPLISDIYNPLDNYLASEIDMVFSGNMRNKDIFMFVTNEDNYGYLVDAENTTTEHLHNDLWEIFSNPLDWHEKYIHKNYSKVANENVQLTDIEQPCPDVFWWPFVSETFAKHLIEEMEYFGKWSDGTNKDPRLEGGYENVPTRDIHMRQVDWEEHWMQILKMYVYPMQIKLFKGYYDEPRARMNFVVRYKPTEQDRLRPHHDAASYTLNLALNRPGIDYEGGGARFNRYKCAVIKSRVGWVLMHPGRVTHIHEGLPTTKGTRYIFVTFVNP